MIRGVAMAISPFNKPRDFHRSTGDDCTPWCGVRAVGQSRSSAGWPGLSCGSGGRRADPRWREQRFQALYNYRKVCLISWRLPTDSMDNPLGPGGARRRSPL